MIDHISASNVHQCPLCTLLNMTIQRPIPREVTVKGKNGESTARQWLLDNGYIIIKEQARLCSNTYCGKVDYIVIKDGKKMVIEIKTSDKPLSELVEYYRLQCTIYHLLTKLPVFLLAVRSDGTIEMMMVEPSTVPLPTLEEVRKGVRRTGSYCSSCWYQKLCQIIEVKNLIGR